MSKLISQLHFFQLLTGCALLNARTGRGWDLAVKETPTYEPRLGLARWGEGKAGGNSPKQGMY